MLDLDVPLGSQQQGSQQQVQGAILLEQTLGHLLRKMPQKQVLQGALPLLLGQLALAVLPEMMLKGLPLWELLMELQQVVASLRQVAKVPEVLSLAQMCGPMPAVVQHAHLLNKRRRLLALAPCRLPG